MSQSSLRPTESSAKSDFAVGAHCPGCRAGAGEPLFSVDRAPVSCGRLFATLEQAARAGRCRLEIVLCAECGHIWNAAHQGTPGDLYNDDYYSSFAASEQGRRYQESLASDLNRVVTVSGKTVLEIGCGDGHFLGLLGNLGANAVGYEPSSTFDLAEKRPGIKVFREQFSFDGSSPEGSDADFVVLRHVLEHLDSPLNVLKSLAAGHPGGGSPDYLFLEVPNVAQLLRDNLYFDFYNDHVHYFSQGSLAHLCASAGWRPTAWIDGRGEFLRLVCVSESTDAGLHRTASPGGGLEEGGDIGVAARRFRRDHRQWREQMVEIVGNNTGSGRRMAVWGAGARGVSLLSGLGTPDDSYAYVVDSDPNKQGKYIPGVQLPVYGPERLRQYPVESVLVTSYTYFDEIWAVLDWFRSSGGKVIRIYPSPEVT